MKAVSLGHNKYCGPAVLSILTGKSTDECAAVISSVNGQYDVKGVTTPDLIRAARKLGFAIEEVNVYGQSLFGALTNLFARPDKDGIYIVTLKGHFVAVEISGKDIWFCDNHTKEPMDAAGAARLGARVISIHKVTKLPDPILIGTEMIVLKTPSGDGYHLSFRRISHFNQGEDENKNIGYLYVHSESEIREIADKLKLI